MKTPPTDAQIRRACRATVAEIVRVDPASGWTVDGGDKILTMVGV